MKTVPRASIQGKMGEGKELMSFKIDIVDEENMKVTLLIDDCEGNSHIKVFKIN